MGLMKRIQDGTQAKIDAEIDRFDRRNEPKPEAWMPPWRRRMLEIDPATGKPRGLPHRVERGGTDVPL